MINASPIVAPTDFCKEPKTVYQDDFGMLVQLHYSQKRDKDNQAPWWMVAKFRDHEIESEYLYDIPDLTDVHQFAADFVISLYNKGSFTI